MLALKQVLMSGSRVTVPGRDEFADELAAMNCLGGTMVLGVDDQSRDISGIPIWTRLKPGLEKSAVREAANGSCDPQDCFAGQSKFGDLR